MDPESNRVAEERTPLFSDEQSSRANSHVISRQQRPLAYTLFLEFNHTPGNDSDNLVIRSLAHVCHVTKVTLYSAGNSHFVTIQATIPPPAISSSVPVSSFENIPVVSHFYCAISFSSMRSCRRLFGSGEVPSISAKVYIASAAPVPATTATKTAAVFSQPTRQRSFSKPARSSLAAVARLGRLLDGRLQLISILGTGAYGVVYAAVDTKTQVRYAAKCLTKIGNDGAPLEQSQITDIQREVRLHHLASAHPNIIPILKIVDNPDCLFIIL
ncbi:hypothetical protein PCL_00438 [Purpureocillium lilacinum]|uniref:Protein kinase domain-containing protein n=1 Tax=Purpureocillium lilacinum TaxID=33203 RepID=A0A2U3DP50_PURLI|nr:hypothetical protein PCL_00438 [Purpureocillium lilacinum]